MTPHADRRVTAEMWLAAVSLSPWHDRTQVELREARVYDGTRVMGDAPIKLEDKK